MWLGWSRYSVGGLLLAVTVCAVALAWWTRPMVVERYAVGGTLAGQFRVKRSWRGELVACGLQRWFLPDGQCFREQEIRGPVLHDNRFVGDGWYGPPVYPPHIPPDPPGEEYVRWLRQDMVPISTDLPRSSGVPFSYP